MNTVERIVSILQYNNIRPGVEPGLCKMHIAISQATIFIGRFEPPNNHIIVRANEKVDSDLVNAGYLGFLRH